MNKHVAAEYERERKMFMKQYGEVHACGQCVHTTSCMRIKIQNSRFGKNKKAELMTKLAPFVTDFEIENHKPKNCEKLLQFIKVYKCDNFVFDGGQ